VFDYQSSPEKKKMQKKLASFMKRQKTKEKRSRHQQRQHAAKALLDFSIQEGGEPAIEEVPIQEDVTVESAIEEVPTSPDICTELRSPNDKDTQTTLTGLDIDALNKECHNLRADNGKLKSELKDCALDIDSLQGNDKKVKTMTGLPSYALLIMLFEYVRGGLLQASKLSPFKQFIMTLMRLRFNVSTQFLGVIFDIDQSTVSRLFNNTINKMNGILVPYLVFWPDREALRKTIPTSFRKNFSRCAVIIDCFEIFIDRPSDLKARAQTYSNYKSHNTAKYLIGITPQGHISFISKGWGGRTSDKHITLHSKFLDNLLPGDIVLADRGFDIGESVAMYQAELRIPAFTKGKKQLDPVDVESTRELACQRIHVERVIGVVRQKFSILQSVIPIQLLQKQNDRDQLTILDKIVRVACALVNTCEPIVPFE
jgi:hypothetical protein